MSTAFCADMSILHSFLPLPASLAPHSPRSRQMPVGRTFPPPSFPSWFRS
jgi:hypothetical protein